MKNTRYLGTGKLEPRYLCTWVQAPKYRYLGTGTKVQGNSRYRYLEPRYRKTLYERR